MNCYKIISMRNLFVIFCIMFCASSFAQENKVIVVSVNSGSKKIGDGTRLAIESAFQKKLVGNYDVRVTTGDDIYSEEKAGELGHGEKGAVPSDERLKDGEGVPADYYCSIIITEFSGYRNKHECLFSAKIWDLKTGLLIKTATYPSVDTPEEDFIEDTMSIRSLQRISSKLLIGLGFEVKD